MITHREAHRDEIAPGQEGRRASASAAEPTRSQDARADGRATAAGLAVAAPLVLALLVRSSALFIGALGLVLVTAVLSPLIGMIALAFVGPFPRPLVVPTAGLYLSVVGAILLGIVLRLPIERPRLRWPPPHMWAIAAFAAYAAIHVFGGVLDGPVGSRSFSTIAPTFLQFVAGALTFVAAGLAVRGRSPYPIVASLLAAAALASTTALAQSMGAEALFGGLIWPAEDRAATAVDRVTGPFLDPNYFGAYLATAMTLGLACTVIARSTWTKAVTMAVSAFVGVAMVLTLSRGALAALAAGIVTIAFTRGRKTGFITLGSMLLAIAIAWPFFAGVRFAADPSRAQGGLGAQLGESSDRTGAWLGGLETFMSSPVFGVGWGRLVDEASTGIPAHNWYINILGETGIVGLILWALFIGSTALALRKRSRSARTVGHSVLATWMVASMFLELPLVYAATGLTFVVLAITIAADWPDGAQEDDRAAARVVPASILRIGEGLRSSRPIPANLSRRPQKMDAHAEAAEGSE